MYIDAAYLNKAFKTAQVAALCPTTDELLVAIELAEGLVECALTMGGYSAAVPSSVYASTDAVPKAIKLAACGAFWQVAHGRNSLVVPREFKEYIDKLEDISEGRIEIPGVAKVVERAVGGIVATETDPSIDGAKPQIFSRDALEGY